MKTVSILTPTYDKRCDFLKFVAKGITMQTYKNILEWVILDGTKTGVSILPGVIEELRKMKNIPTIVYITQDVNRNNKVGALRNILKKEAKGDILIHFDDDDYYPEDRISHAVSRINETGHQLAGNSDLFMYDVHFKSLYQFKSFGQNHILGGTMAYTKKYANNHDFDEKVTHAEESSFTNKYKEPAALLNAKKVIVASSHGINTYSKKKIIWDNLYRVGNKNQTMFFRSNTLKYAVKNKKYIKFYLKTLQKTVEEEKVFEIAFFVGMSMKERYTGLHYNEIHERAKTLVKMGKSVVVYIKPKKSISKDGIEMSGYLQEKDMNNIDGVVYKSYTMFDVSRRHHTVFLVNTFGIIPFIDNKMNLNCEKLYIIDVDMNKDELIGRWSENQIGNKILYPSNMYADKLYSNNEFKKYHIEDFNEQLSLIRSPYYKSENDAGYEMSKKKIYFNLHDNIKKSMFILDTMINIFPNLKNNFPDLEFHIYNYYSFIKLLDIDNKQIKDIKSKLEMGVIKHMDKFIIHEDMPYSEIVKEKYQYQYHYCYTGSISLDMDILGDIKHSVSIGCIPVINSELVQYTSQHRAFFIEVPPNKNGTDLLQIAAGIFNGVTDEQIANYNKNLTKIRLSYWSDPVNTFTEDFKNI